jgi:DNA-binding transcriptional LysR family regulator
VSADEGRATIIDTTIRTFLIITRVGSFSKAAELLQVTQPAISSQIKALEESLGLRLFDRATSGVSLTRAGQIFMKHCGELEKAYDRLEQAMGLLSQSLPGQLTVGITNSIARLIFPAIIARFREKAPKVRVTAQIANSGNLVDLLRLNMLDLAVAASTRVFADLRQEPYLREDLVLIVAPDHRWATHEQITVDDLRKGPFIAREPGSGTRSSLERALRERGLTMKSLKVVMVLGTTDAVVSAVRCGIGASVVPRFSVADEIRDGSVVEVKVAGLTLFKQFFLMCRKERAARSHVRDLIACFNHHAEAARHSASGSAQLVGSSKSRGADRR